MKTNFVIIDDYEALRDCLVMSVERLGISARAYNLPSDLLKELQIIPVAEYPEGYLVDMRIPEELSGSEELYYFLKEKGKVNNFYFMTGSISLHDQEVQKRTGAEILVKGNEKFSHRLKDIVKNLKPDS